MNNPTIVSAALSDKELQDSINRMVANFDKGLKDMLDHTNKYVGKIQESLQKIGNVNFGATGSNDGGVVKQTKAQKEATNETERRLKKEKEVKITLDQQAEIMGRIPREMRMPDMAKSARESFQSFYKGFNEQARQLETLIQSWERLLQSRHTGNIEQVAQQIRNVKSEIAAVIREQANLSKTKPQGYMDEIAKRNTQIKALRDQLVSLESEQQRIKATDPFKGNPYLDTLREKLQAAKVAMNDIDTSNRQWLYRTNELTEAQRKLAEESMKSFYTHTMKMPTDQYDVQLAKLENIRALLQRIRSGEATFFTPTQVTGLEKEERRLVGLIGNINTAQQQVTASVQQTTLQIEKESRALQEQKEHLERIKDIASQARKDIGQYGFANITNYRGVVYAENDERAKGLTIEQQIEKIIQEENAARNAQLGTEKQITQEIEQRGKKYVSPNTEINTAFNRMVANKIGLSEQDINNTSTKISALTQYIKQLEQAWSKMTDAEKNSPFGRQLRQELQYTTRLVQQARTEITRPINLKDALGGSEKTLDDIAYKMQRLRSYKQGIDLTKPNATNEIKQVDEALAKLQKDADKWMSKSNDMIKSNTALGRSWNYMKNRLAFYFTVGASTQFVKNLIEVRSQYEMNERALGILIDSAERGTRIFNELSQMALVSPYTLIELSTAAKQLTAYDVAAKDVVDTTRRLADMAAAVGIPIERLTYALGQIKAYGYLNARDARMFSNAGIPLVKQLAEHYTELEGKMVSTADVYDRIKKKAIDMTDVMQVINKMTDDGGKFFNFQAKMAGTLKVQLANLTLAWNNMLNDIGASEQGTISTGIGLLKELFLEWKNISKMITNLAIGFGVVKAAQLAYYGVVMGTNKAIALETVLGNRLSNNLRSLTSSMNAASMSSTALWVGIATFAAAAVVDILRGNEAMKELNKTLRENAENTYNDLKKFSENYSSLRESLYKTENGKQTPVDINSEEAKKAWEVLREQIELSSHASDEYISKLLSIENVSERLRQGFAIIESIQSVSAAIKELGDSAIKLERDWSAWWNLGLLPDGTIGNLQDAYMWLSKIEDKYGSVENARKVASTSRTDEGRYIELLQEDAKELVENYETELERFKEDLQVTKQSIIDFIELKGWSGDTSKINEVFKTFTDNLILKNQLDPQQAYTLQLQMEEARSKAAKEALLQRIKDEQASLKVSYNQEIAESLKKDVDEFNHWNDFNGRKKVEWERFTKWLKEQHISETTAMFRNMDAEDIRSLNFQEGKHAEWVTRMVTQYAKEHKMSYDEAFEYLKSWVRSANKWSIFIPMTISTEDPKTVYKQLGEYDKAVDEADAQIERLTKRINELNVKKKKSKEETKELADAEKELTQAQKDKAEAEAKGGHGKKEKKDRKEDEKDAKQAETELQKALKDELSTIDKVRSIYKDLTKEGMSHANAVERATKGWGETVDAINSVLQKNGLQKLDLSKFAGIENPRELVNMLQSQLNTLLKRGAKPAEIKELQTKIQTLNVDAEKYDLTKITKGLNNELGKLKDEYELAVELDANPELGNMFTQMFGLDTTNFPKTIDDYMFKVQSEFEKARRELGYGITIDVFKANDDEWKKWGERVGLSGEALDNFKAKFVGAQDVAKKWATDVVNNTKKLEYELAELNDKIAIKEKEQAQLHERIEKEKNETTKHYLELTYQSNEKTIDELRAQALSLMPEYARVFNSIAEYSAGVSRRLQRDLMRVFDEAKYDSASGKWTLTGSDGKKTILNDTQYRKEREKLTKEMRKSQAPFKKIKEAFKPSDKNGVVDYAKGIELVSAEVQKLASVASEVGNLAQIFGADEQTVEIINDVATSLNGVATAGEGISQIASGDYIGGAASVLSGIASVIGAWADNGNKKIDAEIKDSELAVKRLEHAYIDLEHAVNEAYGMATIGANMAAKANKELQLAELKRQLTLEQSRKSKYRDNDRIIELQKEIKELQYDIKEATDEIINDLLGISSVGDAMESMMDAFVEALRSGEDAMAKFDESVDEMIANMVKKMFTTKILQPWFEEQWNKIQNQITERAGKLPDELAKVQSSVSNARMADVNNSDSLIDALRALGFSEEEIHRLNWYNEYGQYDMGTGRYVRLRAAYEKALKEAEQKESELQKEFATATMPTTDDIRQYAELLRSGQPIMEENMQEVANFLRELGLMKDDSDKSLSALQQGIAGVSEETAGALEAITNGISQQSYLQSDLLTQIRDAVVGMDMDVQVATQAQMLLQLQQSYAVQMAIQGILEGWTNPSGQAVRVELLS